MNYRAIFKRRNRDGVSSEVTTMSLWIRRKEPNGKIHYIGSGVVFLLFPLVGILIALLLPLVQSCREWLRG